MNSTHTTQARDGDGRHRPVRDRPGAVGDQRRDRRLSRRDGAVVQLRRATGGIRRGPDRS